VQEAIAHGVRHYGFPYSAIFDRWISKSLCHLPFLIHGPQFSFPNKKERRNPIPVM